MQVLATWEKFMVSILREWAQLLTLLGSKLPGCVLLPWAAELPLVYHSSQLL